MSDVEAVALWVGLIASIVGIVLSGVAIVFAYVVDRRARETTSQTISSLQKIETTVERMSSDTTSLVKAAWDKFLLSGPPVLVETEVARTAPPTNSGDGAPGERVPLRTQVDMVKAQLMNVSPAAVEIARILAGRRGHHLTEAEYHALHSYSDYMRGALSDLRAVGLIVPLRHAGKNGKEVDVFWFPPVAVDNVNPALALLGPQDRAVAARVREEFGTAMLSLAEEPKGMGEPKQNGGQANTGGDAGNDGLPEPED